MAESQFQQGLIPGKVFQKEGVAWLPLLLRRMIHRGLGRTLLIEWGEGVGVRVAGRSRGLY